MKDKKKTLAAKIADINVCWDNEEIHIWSMPEREMIYIGNNTFDGDPKVLDSITLDVNTDWILWELEMMED